MRSNDPPITPEAQQAASMVNKAKITARGSESAIPIVWHVMRVMTAMVTAAPFVLMVEPKGMLME